MIGRQPTKLIHHSNKTRKQFIPRAEKRVRTFFYPRGCSPNGSLCPWSATGARLVGSIALTESSLFREHSLRPQVNRAIDDPLSRKPSTPRITEPFLRLDQICRDDDDDTWIRQ